MRRSLIAMTAVAVFCLCRSAHAGMIGINFDGSTVLIDEATGTFSPLGPTGFGSTNSLAASAGGVLYTATALLAPLENVLLTIDPLTGAGTTLATLDFGGALVDIRAMAVRPSDDALFAISAGGTIFTFDTNLYRINPATGIGTFIAFPGSFGVQGLDFSPGGVLYGWSIFIGLVTIDQATGAIADVNPLDDGGLLQSIAFSPTGGLYGASIGQLFTIDLATGIETPLGPGGFSSLRGIEFVPTATVPGPATVTLVGFGLAATALRARLRRRGQQV